MKNIDMYEVVKEYEFLFMSENLYKAKGKILKNLNPSLEHPFSCEVSHKYKLKGSENFYNPSGLKSISSLKDAEIELINYFSSIENNRVEENKNY